jgi:hypothetical protein
MPDTTNRDDATAPAATPAAEEGQEDRQVARPEDQEGLTDYWDDILGPRPEAVEARLIRELGIPHKGVLTLATNSGRIIVRIAPDGRVEYGEGYTPDAAAELFWTNMALKRVGMENRLRHLAIMETMLIRVGRADLAYERALLASREDGATEHSRQLAEMARRNLEVLVHGVIELSRGLALRPTAPSQDSADEPDWQTAPPAPAPQTNPAPGPPGSGGDPNCATCGGSGRVPGDDGDSPNVWFDPCPQCMPQETELPDVDPEPAVP